VAATDKGDADLHRGELTRQPFARHLVITFVAAVFKFADEGFFGGGTAQTQRRRAKAAPGSSPRGIRSEPFVHKVLLCDAKRSTGSASLHRPQQIAKTRTINAT
jgi:hypothetical protein